MFKFLRLASHKSQPVRRSVLTLDQLDAREAPASLHLFSPLGSLSLNLPALGNTSVSVGILAPIPTPTPTPTPAPEPTPTPTPAQSSGMSGTVQIDTGAGPGAMWFASVVTLSIDGNAVETVDVNPDGTYSFTVSLDHAANYTLEATAKDGDTTYYAPRVSGTIQPGQQITNQTITFTGNG
jgi:hypothetical protein